MTKIQIRASFSSLFIAMLLPVMVIAQAGIALKMGAVGGPAGSGPSTSSQTVTLLENGLTPHVPATTVTYSIVNQQFGPGAVQGIPAASGANFGASASASDSAFTSNPLYSLMNAIGGPTNALFSACNTCVPGVGIDVTTDRTVSLHLNSDSLIDAASNNLQPVNGRIYYGDLVITFSRPVANPVLHFVGMGGSTVNNVTDSSTGITKFYDLGFSAEFDLVSAGVTLSKLAGNASFNVTPGSIANSATNIGGGSVPALMHGITRNGATGSALASGTNITSITLRMYLRGDGGIVVDAAGVVQAATPGWGVKWARATGYQPPGAPTASIGGVSGDFLLLGAALQTQPPVLGLVKTCSSPATCTTSAQAPGTDVTYNIGFSNNGDTLATNTTIVDPIPINTDFKLGSATSSPGTTGITFVIEYSADNGATWAYVPVSGGGGAAVGYDRNVKAVRWRTTDTLTFIAPNNSGSVSFIARIQ